MKPAAFWRWITRLGVDDELDSEARYVVMVNASATVGVLIVASYLPLLAFFGEEARPFQVLCLAQLPVWALPLVLNSRRRHQAAKNVLALGCVGFFSSQLLLFGPVYGHQYFFLLLAIGPFLAFPPRHRVSMWAWFGVDSPAT